MSPIDLLFVVAALCWFSAILLSRAAWRYPELQALRERAVAALVIAAGVTVYSVVAWDVDFGGWWDQSAARTVARFSVAAIGLVPNLYWLWLFARGKDREG